MDVLNYINGNCIAPIDGHYIPNVNPATGKVYGQIPDSNQKDIDLAVAAAEKAFPIWSKTPAEKRFQILNRIAELIDEQLAELAIAETNDNGKPIGLSTQMDIPRASSNFRFFATAVLQFASESHASENNSINFTLRQPIGIVGCISPWNLPLYLFTWKIAPALAAGNCVIAKPSEVTPVSAFLLSSICIKAGLPNGVLNIVHGTGPTCGEAIVAHPKIKAISFTGSTRAGSRIASVAAPMFKKLSLELGGKNPTLIFADCNWDEMMQTTLRSSFTNQGQICLCGSRLLIERKVYDKFKTEFVEKVKALIPADPLDKNSKQGAIVSAAHYEKILRCIAIAQEEGGTILCGGKPVLVEGRCAEGFFIAPTVIEGLPQQCVTNQEEIFGPVVTIQPFDDDTHALELANASGYGLATSIWTQNINRAHQLSEKIEIGIVWINCWLNRDLRTPFGGVKNSGTGREGGWEAMRFFTEPKNVCIKF